MKSTKEPVADYILAYRDWKNAKPGAVKQKADKRVRDAEAAFDALGSGPLKEEVKKDFTALAESDPSNKEINNYLNNDLKLQALENQNNVTGTNKGSSKNPSPNTYIKLRSEEIKIEEEIVGIHDRIASVENTQPPNAEEELKLLHKAEHKAIDKLVGTSTTKGIAKQVQEAKKELTAQGVSIPTDAVVKEGFVKEVGAKVEATIPNTERVINTIGIEEQEEEVSLTNLSDSIKNAPTNNAPLFIPTNRIQPLESSATQLLQGDQVDPRAFQLIMPLTYIEPVPAYFRVIKESGEAYSSLDSGVSLPSNKSIPTLENPFIGDAYYNQFFLRGFKESHEEKYQVVETHGGHVVFGFGEKPEIWSIYGNLINDIYNNWTAKFRSVWEEHIRLSKLIENKSYLRIVIPTARLSFNCYPIAYSLDHSSENEALPTWGMSMIIRDVRNMPSFVFKKDTSAVGILQAMQKLETRG